MVWFLVCVGVAIAAFVMWEDINPELPEMLRLPQSSAHVAHASGKAPAAPAAPAITSYQWTFSSDDKGNWRASREFQTPIIARENRYYPPVLHISCYGSNLFAWVDTGLRASEVAGKPGIVAVRVNNGAEESWTSGEGTVIATPSPSRLIATLAKSSELSMTLAFKEAPAQALSLSTSGFQALGPHLVACEARR